MMEKDMGYMLGLQKTELMPKHSRKTLGIKLACLEWLNTWSNAHTDITYVINYGRMSKLFGITCCAALSKVQL
jgi:hypothetical protein